MFARYVFADLVRNPRRTLSTTIGVFLGVGLFCAVLFFVDGLSASMTQRAVAPLPIDMQRILTETVGGDIRMALTLEPGDATKPGDRVTVRIAVINQGEVPANEVTVRSAPLAGLEFVPGSAVVAGTAVQVESNPFSSGLTKAGLNIGTIPAKGSVAISYQAVVTGAVEVSPQTFPSTFSTREAQYPIAANSDDRTSLDDLLAQIRAVGGVTFAEPLFLADLPAGALSAQTPVGGAARVFGFDADYTSHDRTVKIVAGAQVPGNAMISAEAAAALGVGIGDSVTLDLPDGTRTKLAVSGITALTQARALFSSRRGADFETFVYVPNSLVIDTKAFADIVMPAFARATTGRGKRVKAPPVREIDIGVQRDLLDAEPSVALGQTQRIGAAISAVAAKQDFLLDNISNTLAVARDDATTAKHLFVVLGLPGAMLAAMLAAYAGVVLGSAQRRERAILRIRGASRRNLLSMLALRVGCIAAAGALVGMALGYASAATVLGQATLARITVATLAASGLLGAVMGLVATGVALYLTGRRSIDREINEDRAQLWMRPPAWRRWWLDLAGLAAVSVATLAVVAASGFQGVPGSVYVGRAVHLPLGLLTLPIGVWIAGSFFGGRLFALVLERWRGGSRDGPLALLFQRSVQRRSWALADAAVILALIVALGTSLAVFTASYDGAKAADARYVTGSDLKIAPGAALRPRGRAGDMSAFAVEGVTAIAPVIYALHNTVLRSKRTEEVANVAALDPIAYQQVAPLEDGAFSTGSAHAALGIIADRDDAILVSRDMAAFLKARVGDRLLVLLARGSAEQVEIDMEVVGLFDRIPGFPDGADAIIKLARYEALVASSAPTFYLAKTSDGSGTALGKVATALRRDPGAGADLAIDTPLTALARDQSSLAALNIAGLLTLNSAYVLAMGTATVVIFVFGLLLQRRREYVTLRALGMQPRAIRALIGAEAGTVVLAGCVAGVPVGLAMAWYLINLLRPLFVLTPPYVVPFGTLGVILGSIALAAAATSVLASSLVNRLQATELLRDE